MDRGAWGRLQSMESQRVREDIATEQQQQQHSIMLRESSLIVVREPTGSRKLECLRSNPVFAAK